MVFVLYFVLRALVLVTLVRSAFLGHYEHMMLCVLTLVLLLVPSLIEHTLDIELPDLLESIILLFIFAAEILGRDRRVLHSHSVLGYHPAHHVGIPVRGYWLCVVRYSQSQRLVQNQTDAPIYGRIRSGVLYVHWRVLGDL